MVLSSFSQVFLAGFCGGALLELLHWYSLRRDTERFPQYARSPLYWFITLAMACAGGGLAVLYFGGRADGILAVHVGLSTPLLIQKLTTTVVQQPGAKSLTPSPISFFSW
jgi:hypothetical protein